MSRQGATSKLNGGEWVQLRAYTMDVGDGWYVRVSNRSSAVGYIITEAVKAIK
jgi:hypothetical protein